MPNTDRCASHAHKANNCCPGFEDCSFHLLQAPRYIPMCGASWCSKTVRPGLSWPISTILQLCEHQTPHPQVLEHQVRNKAFSHHACVTGVTDLDRACQRTPHRSKLATSTAARRACTTGARCTLGSSYQEGSAHAPEHTDSCRLRVAVPAHVNQLSFSDSTHSTARSHASHGWWSGIPAASHSI